MNPITQTPLTNQKTWHLFYSDINLAILFPGVRTKWNGASFDVTVELRTDKLNSNFVIEVQLNIVVWGVQT
jgi:hypothetical protein